MALKEMHLMTKCPHCAVNHDRASNVDPEGSPPVSGDASMCIACGRWAIFDDDLQLRKPTSEEMEALGRHYDLKKLHLAWEAAMRFQRKAAP